MSIMIPLCLKKFNQSILFIGGLLVIGFGGIMACSSSGRSGVEKMNDERTETVDSSDSFRYCYYLFEQPNTDEPCIDCYIPLLISRKPLEEAPVEVYAFVTYERDSIYLTYPIENQKRSSKGADPESKKVEKSTSKTIHIKADQISHSRRTIQFKDKKYRYQRIPNGEVVHLLKNPEGDIPVSRPYPPLTYFDKDIVQQLIHDLEHTSEAD